MKTSHLDHDFFGQPGVAIAFPTSHSFRVSLGETSSFGGSVAVVIQRSPEKEMIRPYAVGNVAGVADEKISWRPLPCLEKPSDSMGWRVSAAIFRTQSNSPISLTRWLPGEEPATFALANSCPVALGKRDRLLGPVSTAIAGFTIHHFAPPQT